MIEASGARKGNVTPFPARNPTPLTDELNRILNSVRDACPKGSIINFSFDGHLRIHIDVRRLEDVTLIEAVLPNIEPNLFYGWSRTATPHHSFFHRVSATVVS